MATVTRGRKINNDGFGARSLSTVHRLLDPHKKERGDQPALLAFGPGSLSSPALKVAAPLRRRHTINEGARAAKLDIRAVASVGRNASKQSLPPPAPAPAMHDAEIVIEKKKERHDADCVAIQLALKHRLMLSEVKCIIKEFLKAKRDETGGIERTEFDSVLARIFDVPSVKKKLCEDAYNLSQAATEINIDCFLDWYVQNMFGELRFLTADQDMVQGDALAYELASKFQVSNIMIDKIKKKFDTYDTDKSGLIDFDEFQHMFCSILKCGLGDLNSDRISRFWKEIDANCDDGVDFTEFIRWYLKYFSPDNEEDDFDMVGPLANFYHSFDPTTMRHMAYEHKFGRDH